MSKKLIKKVSLFAAVFFLAYSFNYQDKLGETAGKQFLPKGLSSIPADISQVCLEKTCFDVEIADTAYKQEIGLMNRESLGRNRGMLFVFGAEDKHKFWMKNTLIPLDIIWIGGNSKIIFMQKNAQPCKIDPCEIFGPDENAKYILEINGGLAENIELEIGDEIRILGN